MKGPMRKQRRKNKGRVFEVAGTAGAKALRPGRAWHVAKRRTDVAGGREMQEFSDEAETMLSRACFNK